MWSTHQHLPVNDIALKMPKSLQKTRKQIAKKRHGTIDALHQNSRDSKRLHRASVRDQRLEKLAAARSKKEQPLRLCLFTDISFVDLETSG
jgi:translation machinery-associated protein 16